MPQAIAKPVLVGQPARHVTSVHAGAPIGGTLAGNVVFTTRETYEDGTHFDYGDGSVAFTLAELAALPSFAAFYTELRDAAYAKRLAQTP